MQKEIEHKYRKKMAINYFIVTLTTVLQKSSDMTQIYERETEIQSYRDTQIKRYTDKEKQRYRKSEKWRNREKESE